MLIAALLSLTLIAVPAQADAPEPQLEERREAAQGDRLRVEQFVELALARSSQLEAARFAVDALAARVDQASRLANPELTIDVENLAGSGAYAGTRSAETTVLLHQPIDLSSRRSARRRAAELERARAALELEVQRSTVRAEVAAAAVRVVLAQRRLALARELEREVSDFATARRGSGKEAGADLARGEVALAESRTDAAVADRDLRAAREILALRLAMTTQELPALSDELPPVRTPPTLDELIRAVTSSPEVLIQDTDEDLGSAQLALERARRVSPVSIGAGYRRIAATDDGAAVFALAIPLPVFDRNDSNIRAAEAELERTRALNRGSRRMLEMMTVRTHRELVTTHTRVVAYHEDVVPEAKRAYERTRESYADGVVDYLAYADSRRTLFRLRGEHLEAIEAYYLARIALGRWLHRSS